MNDNDELNDSAVLNAVRDSICGLPMPAAPRLQAITARGRARRRRLGGLAMAGAGACAALAVGLAAAGLAGQASAASATARSVSGPSGGVLGRRRPDGATTLTLYPGQVANPNAVRQALAEHGIPALVTAGRFCRTADQPPPGVGQVVVLSPGPQQAAHPARRGPARS